MISYGRMTGSLIFGTLVLFGYAAMAIRRTIVWRTATTTDRGNGTKRRI